MAQAKKLARWSAHDVDGQSFCLENGERSFYSRAHCRACAFAEAVTRYGGDVDMRGLQRYGICASFLATFVRQSREEAKAKCEL